MYGIFTYTVYYMDFILIYVCMNVCMHVNVTHLHDSVKVDIN